MKGCPDEFSGAQLTYTFKQKSLQPISEVYFRMKGHLPKDKPILDQINKIMDKINSDSGILKDELEEERKYQKKKRINHSMMWLVGSFLFTALVFLAYFLLTAEERARKDTPIFEINRVTMPIVIVLSVINIIILVRIVTLCTELEFIPKTKFLSFKGNHNLEVVQ